jgi:hypothetical protein
MGLIIVLLIAGIGGWIMYEVNAMVFRLVESATPERHAWRIAILFTAAVLVGAIAAVAGSGS